MIKTMTDTYSLLKQKLPLELTVRYLTAYFEVNHKKCNGYMS